VDEDTGRTEWGYDDDCFPYLDELPMEFNTDEEIKKFMMGITGERVPDTREEKINLIFRFIEYIQLQERRDM